MKAIGELLFGLAFLLFAGNIVHKTMFQSIKKESLTQVDKGLSSLSSYTYKLTSQK